MCEYVCVHKMNFTSHFDIISLKKKETFMNIFCILSKEKELTWLNIDIATVSCCVDLIHVCCQVQSVYSRMLIVSPTGFGLWQLLVLG